MHNYPTVERIKIPKFPIDVASDPSVFQRFMEQLLGDPEFIRVYYIDDVLVVPNGDHLEEEYNQLLAPIEMRMFRANVRH
jgi:hypothetical protein